MRFTIVVGVVSQEEIFEHAVWQILKGSQGCDSLFLVGHTAEGCRATQLESLLPSV